MADLLDKENWDSSRTMNNHSTPSNNFSHNSDEDKTIPRINVPKDPGKYQAGQTMLGHYVILEELGGGGMGIVFKCFDNISGCEVALKALPPELAHDKNEIEAVRDNYKLVSKLVHQNIAVNRNLELDPETGNLFLIMECIEGEELRKWTRRKRMDGNISLNDILPILEQIADALDYAHASMIIHRDIKPGNIMITPEGNVKILDFGLAAQIHTSMSHVSMLYGGNACGTAPYMSPEQWKCKAQGAAADQYALAVLTYEILAGHLPFDSPDMSVLRQAVLEEPMDEIPDVPKYANAALARALSKNAQDRFRSCKDFVRALSGKKVRSSKNNGAKIIIPVCLLALIAIGILAYFFLIKPSQEANQNIAFPQTIARTPVQQPGAIPAAVQPTGTTVQVPAPQPEQEENWDKFHLTENVTIEMKEIPKGTFTMGSPVGEVFRYADEVEHKVVIANNFWMGKFEVTQEQWKAVMGSNPSTLRGSNLPVESVTREDCLKFCETLNKKFAAKLQKEHLKFDLPTEAQWEYACRARNNTALNNGGIITVGSGQCKDLEQIGWYASNSGMKTHEVGQLKPNAWGLYDMHGNVWEWCRDDYGEFTGDATDPCLQVAGATKGVRRGGCFALNARSCRAAYRARYDVNKSDKSLGFRLALVPDL